MMSGAGEIQALAADIGATAKRIGALADALPPAELVTRAEFAVLEARVALLEARWPQPGSAPAGVLVFTEDARHDGPARELDGAVIDGAAFVHLDIPSDHVDRVRFTLDGAETSPGETKPPYDLYQPSSQPLRPLDLSEGEHRVEAIVSYQDGSERSAAAVFTVDHASAGDDPSPGSGPTGPAEDPYNLFDWEPGDPSTGSGPDGPVGPAPWGVYEIPASILDDTVRPRFIAPVDLTGWSDYPDGAIVLLGPRHTGTLDFSNKRDVDFIPSSHAAQRSAASQSSTGRALIDRSGETEAFAVFASHAEGCALHNIDVRGGIRLEDCAGCLVAGCDVSAAHVHGIWLAGGGCHHNEVAFTDSHDNGREKAYEKKPGDWRSLGHGYIPTNGAHHNKLHHYRGYRNWEDGIQLSPDCGAGNVHEVCMVWWNNEDGVDTKCNRGNVFRHVHSRRNRYGGFNHHSHQQGHARDLDPIVMESCSSYDENSPVEVEQNSKLVSSGGRYRSAKNSCLKVTSGVDEAIVSTDEDFANGWHATARIDDSKGSRFTRATFRSNDDDPACLVRGDARDVVFQDCRFLGKTGLTVTPPATAAVS